MQKIYSILLIFLSLVNFAKGENMQIVLSFENEKFIVDLEDNPATRDFVRLLPLELEFSDYVGKEKISPALPKRLDTKGLNGYTPKIGDLFYFSPWGNLGIFYEIQPFHNGLVKFGTFKPQELAKIKAKNENFRIKIERIEQ